MNNSQSICPRCKGEGNVIAVVKPIHSQSEPNDMYKHFIPCPQLGCHGGKFNRDEYYRSWQ